MDGDASLERLGITLRFSQFGWISFDSIKQNMEYTSIADFRKVGGPIVLEFDGGGSIRYHGNHAMIDFEHVPSLSDLARLASVAYGGVRDSAMTGWSVRVSAVVDLKDHGVEDTGRNHLVKLFSATASDLEDLLGESIVEVQPRVRFLGSGNHKGGRYYLAMDLTGIEDTTIRFRFTAEFDSGELPEVGRVERVIDAEASHFQDVIKKVVC